MGGIDQLLYRWKEGFYSEPFYACCELLALAIGCYHYKKNKIGKFFLLYITFDLLILIFQNYVLYFSSFPKFISGKIVNATNDLVCLVELLVYYYFFRLVIRSKAVIKLIKLLRVIFFFLFFIYALAFLLTFQQSAQPMAYPLGVVEFIFLIIPCFRYFVELFIITPSLDLFKKPSFWITTGIFFYSAISIPLYSVIEYLLVNNYRYYISATMILFSLPFGINFLFLSKSFMCKKNLTI
jgi:hypothetical protein